jgi:hypothetical protein|tara:strand:- start:7537 stop:7866 length:330 start_codon:yes stop_codon:yes gene_type:complete
MFFWSSENIGKEDSEGNHVPIEYRYMVFEPSTHKSFLDFIILFRWSWSVFIAISSVVFFFFGWIPSAITFSILIILWYIIFKFKYKRFENSLNEVKDKFKKMYQSIFGH